MSAIRRTAAVLVAALLGAGLVGASQLRWRASPSQAAGIRLSWRTVSEPVSECRAPTPEELEGLPPHMRMKEICERRHAPWRLVVRIDDRVVRDVRLVPAGASGDRPLYVFEDLRVAPGSHRLAVTFSEERTTTAPAAAQRAPIALDVSVELAPRQVALVTLDESGERLELD